MAQSSSKAILPLQSFSGFEDSEKPSIVFHPTDLLNDFPGSQTLNKGDVVLRKNKVVEIISVDNYLQPPSYTVKGWAPQDQPVNTEIHYLTPLIPKAMRNTLFLLTNTQLKKSVIASLDLKRHHQTELDFRDWKAGTILASSKVIRSLGLMPGVKPQVSIKEVQLPEARVLVVGSKMHRDKVELDINDGDHFAFANELTSAADSIRRYKVVRPNQPLKKFSVREIHVSGKSHPDTDYVRVTNETKFLFEWGKQKYANEQFDILDKDEKRLFCKPKVEYDMIDVGIVDGKSLLDKVTTEIKRVPCIHQRKNSLQIVVTNSFHHEIKAMDVLWAIDGEPASGSYSDEHKLMLFRQNKFYMNDQMIATFARPRVESNEVICSAPGAAEQSNASQDQKGSDEGVVNGVKLIVPSDVNMDVTESYEIFLEDGDPEFDDDVTWGSEDDAPDWSEDEGEEPTVADDNAPVAPDRPQLKDILRERDFRTVPVGDDGDCFWESVAILRNPHSSIEVLRARGKVMGLREATFYRLKDRFERGELTEFGITMDQIERIADPKEWSGNLEIAELSRNLRQQIRVWVIQFTQLEELFTTELVRAPEGENQPEVETLNILYCNSKDPLSEMDRNHYLPLLSVNDVAEGLGFTIVWEDLGHEGDYPESDNDSWENISVGSDVQSVCSLDDFDEVLVRGKMLADKDVKVAIVVYRMNGTEVGVMLDRDKEEYNFPHGTFVEKEPMQYARDLIEEMAWMDDPSCFAILPRIMVVQEKDHLVLLFPALCNCNIQVMNDYLQEWKWLEVNNQLSKTLPGTMAAIATRGKYLLERFREELPPIEDRNTRESAELIMTQLRLHAKRLGKDGIKQEEMIEYLYKHPQDMEFMLENLYNPAINVKPLFMRMQRYLRDKMQRMAEINDAPKEIYIDGSNPVFYDETEQMKEDRLLAEALQLQMDEELAKQMDKDNQHKSKKSDRVKFSQPDSGYFVPAPKRSPVPANRPGSRFLRGDDSKNPRIKNVAYKGYEPLKRPSNIGSYIKCLFTFKTRGAPNETIRKGWDLKIVNESFDDGHHLILVDHQNLKFKQWLGLRDFVNLENPHLLSSGKKKEADKKIDLVKPQVQPVVNLSEPDKKEPQPSAPEKSLLEKLDSDAVDKKQEKVYEADVKIEAKEEEVLAAGPDGDKKQQVAVEEEVLASSPFAEQDMEPVNVDPIKEDWEFV